MTKVFSDRIISAIDVGTTKICVLIAERHSDSFYTIIGIGKASSEGLKKGIVVDINKTVESIQSAVKEAELMAGTTISSAYVGISGSHIQATNSPGSAPIKRGIVCQSDIDSVIAASRAIPVPEGQKIIHTLPQYFIIDNLDHIHKPHGMHGVRLEVMTHVIMGSTGPINNLITCCQQAGIEVRDLILEPLASSMAVLNSDEQELGAGILDIGGGTSDFAVVHQGSIRHTKVLPVGGTQFTRDIAIGLRTTLQEAERIKQEYGTIYMADDSVLPIEISPIQGQAAQQVCSSQLVSIIHARAQELFLLIKQEIEQYDVRRYMASGLVITGGGSLLRGLDVLAGNIVGMPVRMGAPIVTNNVPLVLKSPLYATAYGLLMYTCQEASNNKVNRQPLIRRIVTSMKSWVTDFL